jgi:hypothetical protein
MDIQPITLTELFRRRDQTRNATFVGEKELTEHVSRLCEFFEINTFDIIAEFTEDVKNSPKLVLSEDELSAGSSSKGKEPARSWNEDEDEDDRSSLSDESENDDGDDFIMNVHKKAHHDIICEDFAAAKCPSPLHLRLSTSLQNDDGQSLFVLAHEIAHLKLHTMRHGFEGALNRHFTSDMWTEALCNLLAVVAISFIDSDGYWSKLNNLLHDYETYFCDKERQLVQLRNGTLSFSREDEVHIKIATFRLLDLLLSSDAVFQTPKDLIIFMFSGNETIIDTILYGSDDFGRPDAYIPIPEPDATIPEDYEIPSLDEMECNF